MAFDFSNQLSKLFSPFFSIPIWWPVLVDAEFMKVVQNGIFQNRTDQAQDG